MKKKLSLELDALTVDSFDTVAAGSARGTVQGLESEDETELCINPDCTCVDSCLCPTNAYYCATVMATVVSCDYTYNGSCRLTAVTCGGISCNRCPD
jgi:hypothetical protein